MYTVRIYVCPENVIIIIYVQHTVTTCIHLQYNNTNYKLQITNYISTIAFIWRKNMLRDLSGTPCMYLF